MPPRAGEEQPMAPLDAPEDALGLVPTIPEQPENMEDEFPPLKYVWRNVTLMGLLHLGALYGLWLIPQAKWSTLIFSKYLLEGHNGVFSCISTNVDSFCNKHS